MDISDQMQQKNSKKKSDKPNKMWQSDFLFEQYPDGVLIIDSEGRIIDANKTFLEISGYTRVDLEGKKMEILIPKNDRTDHVSLRKGYTKNPTKRPLESGIEPRLLCKDGTTFPVDLMLSPLETDAGRFTVTLVRDITEKHRILKNERETREMLNAVLNSAPVAIYCLSPEAIVLSWSKEAEKLFGYKASEVVNKPYKLVPEVTKKQQECIALLEQVFEGKTIRDVQRKRLHKDGSLVDVSISAAPMYDASGNLYAATYAAENIFERLKKLNHLAYFDPLTKLPNLACLQKDLTDHLDNNKGLSPPISLSIIELGGLHEANDTLMGSNKSKLIKKVALRLKDITPKRCKIYHSGRCEFAITIPKSDDPTIIMSKIETIVKQLHIPFKINKQKIHISVNAGVTIAPLHGQDAEELLSNTSLALNSAKNDNLKNTYLFSMSIRTSAQESRELDIDLQNAFEKDEFELFYQPQINLLSGKIIGAEALLRWRHKKHGIIPPSGFIDALSKNPIAYDVGKWITRSAIKQAANWRKIGLGDLRVGVNMFGSQFEHDLVKDVKDALADFSLPANLLELEITENIALNCDRDIIKPLRILKDMGVGISFDDFGTGYASLSYLLQYPLTRIKIDKSFLENIPKSAEEAAIVRAIITMSHSLSLEVITEGVETKEHVEFLCLEQCEEAQGYYYSKPISAQEFCEYTKSANEKVKIKNKVPAKEKIAS